ncbi:MAG: FAD-binding oxidoreductase, partial [Clostridia bacterium]|nr:FAD-binding oxidoreductase [Clostridia bacterium]
MYQTVWTESCNIKEYPSLDGDRRCGVLVIGGGIAGILTAYFLKQAGVDCLVAEGKRIGMGVTACTTAQTTAQQELMCNYLTKRSGVEKAKQFLHANLWAVEKFRSLSKQFDFDFEDRDSYVYTLKDIKKIEEEVKALNDIGYKSELVSKLPLPLDIKAAYRFRKQAQINPLKLIAALAKDLDIVENTFVQKVEKGVAYTDKGIITADKIVIATHFPFINTSGFYFAKMYQQRSYVLALEHAPDYNAMYIDEENYGMYFRNYQKYFLVGGGDHRTGKKGGSFGELENFVKERYPDSEIKYRWATQDCITHDAVPYIGRYSKTLQNVYVATGYTGWGMTGAMISARLLSEMITEKESEFFEVFNSLRCAISAQLFLNLGESVINLINPSPKRCTHLG